MPNGVSYVDPGVPSVNYFHGGDAVHGYPRAAYRYPQSNGCLELPAPTAARVYPLLQIGDLVTVAGNPHLHRYAPGRRNVPPARPRRRQDRVAPAG